MSVLALHHRPDERELRRYGSAAIAIVALHVAVIAAALLWYERPQPAGVSIEPIFVELAPAPAAPQIQPEDRPPGPKNQQAEAPPPEPPKMEKVEEQLPPTPPQPEPVVAAPPKAEPKPEPTPVKPKPIREKKKPNSKRLVERSTAAKAARIAPDAPSPGASSAAALASYRSILSAHLRRFKRYPDDARDGERGRVSLTITVARSGRVTSSRLTKSSGSAALDRAALALIQRAQPMPPFPPDMREASKVFAVPLYYKPSDR